MFPVVFNQLFLRHIGFNKNTILCTHCTDTILYCKKNLQYLYFAISKQLHGASYYVFISSVHGLAVRKCTLLYCRNGIIQVPFLVPLTVNPESFFLRFIMTHKHDLPIFLHNSMTYWTRGFVVLVFCIPFILSNYSMYPCVF